MSMEIKLKCSHEEIVFIEEYCAKNSIKLDDLFAKFIEGLKPVLKESSKESKSNAQKLEESAPKIEDEAQKEPFVKKKKPAKATDD